MFGIQKNALVSLILLAAFAGEPALAQVPVDLGRIPEIEQDITDGEAAERANQDDVAEGHYKAAEIKLTEMPIGNDTQLGDVYALLRKLMRKEKKYPEAIDYGNKLIALEIKRYGPNHIWVADSTKQLADIQTEAEQFNDARTNYWRAAQGATAAWSGHYRQGAATEKELKARKFDLILACYDGIAKTYELENNPRGVATTYKQAIAAYGRVRDPDMIGAKMQVELYNRYRNFMAKMNEQAAAADADEKVTTFRRHEYLNQEYPSGVLPKQ